MPNPFRIRAAALTAALVLAALPTGCSSGSGDGDLAAQKLDWKNCPAPDEAEGGGDAPSPLPGGGTWQCATMKAPLDWSKPKGATIGLALIRARASGDASKRIGSLIFNFGGPGGSGVTTLPAFGTDYAALRTRYDLVSFDPRGVGRSDPVECENDAQLDNYFQQDATPDTRAERTQLINRTRQFNAACEKNSRAILPQVRTTDAARDMDLMRQVLGDAKMHYFGISYGTELGGVYAHLFPKNVGRAVFDGVVDPTQDPEQSSLGQAKGFQLALDNFAEECTSKQAECPIGDTPQDVKDRIAKLLADLDKKPIPGILPRELTQSAATNGIAQSLYSKDFWEYLTEGLEEAYDGDGKILMLLSDSMNGRSENGEYSNITAANIAINCADEKPRYTADYVQQKLPEFRAASPLFGDYLAWGMVSCTDWAVPGAADHPDVSAPGAAPILVVGNTGDPATPYEGARKMVDALGKGVGVELTYKGQGHGAYDSKDKCVQGAVNGYLLEGTVPKAGTVCT
ncbi:MAG: alpha/beta fold hydrolase [Streptomyces sp.]|jgi:pimeloyl-ACP methyl ester carboxylesterase|uniref:alpha/beta hydrolase n=1 Tax=Streptomyces sp. TaxID=1931 RepID=UPI0025DB0599|nr:alpha/beta hydrolase [Streptomyces sp.]MBW8798702.1 alpha/beta fold hydrolase [Streptomyces sp.]